jgi:hypothetical protein
VVLLGVLLGVAGLPGHSHVVAPAPIALPTFDVNCAGHQPALSVIPVRVITTSSDGTIIVAGVCLDDKGPFTFLVDTGAAVSLLDQSVVKTLDLPGQSRSVSTTSFGCHTEMSFAWSDSWSIGGNELNPQYVEVADVRSPEVPALDGIIGSDVLSSFGAVRIDYMQQTLTLAASQQMPLTNIPGDTRPPTVGTTVTAGESHTVPMPVTVEKTHSPYELTVVRPMVSVSIGSASYHFVLDTGATRSAISPETAHSERLTRVPPNGYAYAGLACRITVSRYHLSSWRIVDINLEDQLVGSSVLGPGQDGLFGCDTLRRYSPIVVDYKDGELLLGPHATN